MVRRAYFAWAIMVLITCMLTACGASLESNLIGTWQLAPGSSDDLTIEFRDGGAVIWTQDGRSIAGTFKTVKDKDIQLTISGDLGPVMVLFTDVTLEKDRLTMSRVGDDVRIDLFRVKP